MISQLTLEGGVWPLLLGLILAPVVTASYVWLHPDLPLRARLAPAILRGAVILLIGLMLAGPTLQTDRSSSVPGRVTLLVDRSASMDIADPQLPAGRKLLLARSLWGFEAPAELLLLHEMASDLRTAAHSIDGQGVPPDAAATVRDVAARLAELEPDLLPEVAPAGQVLLETWQNVPGHRLEEVSPLPPDRPADRVETISMLQFPRDAGEDYLRRVTGGLRPPSDGDYTFYLSADATAILALDLDGNGIPEPLLRVDEKTPPGTAGQRSQPVSLSADSVYAFTLLHKEATGDDHLGLMWSAAEDEPAVPDPAALSLQSDPATPEQRRDALSDEFATTLLQLVDDPQSSPALVKRSASEWADRLSRLFDRQVERTLEMEQQEGLQRAISMVESTTRRDRADRLVAQFQELLEGTDIRVETFSADSPALTDLAQPLSALPSDSDQRGVAVLITDGRHVALADSDQSEALPSPVESARRLNENGIKVFGVVVGSRRPPQDLTTTGVALAEIIHIRDRLTGAVVVRDTMPGGIPIQISLSNDAGQVIWSEQATTTGEGERRFTFDLPAAGLVDDVARMPVAEGETRQDQVILLTARVDAVEGEARPDNNVAETAVRLTAGSGRILIIDGRPRWESRFLGSLLERDLRWDVSTVYTDAAPSTGILPTDEETWREFDLVVLGDVPVEVWSPDALTHLADFVAEHGGGLVVLDGLRGHLVDYAQSPLADVLPVVRHPQSPLAVTSLQGGSGRSAGVDLAAGELAPETWGRRLPPQWVMPISVSSPVAVILAEAVTSDERILPVVVTARVGRGRVWYQAFDETWRWRRGDEEAVQRNYWNAVAGVVMRPPWFAENEARAISVDALSVQPGASAGVRVRFKDPTGPPGDGTVVVRLDQVSSFSGANPGGSSPADPVTFELAPIAGEPGDWSGQIVAPSQPGLYEVRVHGQQSDPTSEVAARFLIHRSAGSGEFSRLEADPDALAAIAAAGGGESFPEEQFLQLRQAIGKLSQTRQRLVTYELWAGWPILILIVGLLGAEWLLRRRSGLA